ncbi:LysR family transcriptional regulator [Ponticaulis sp.]|uniref:LysR family transcriptional regulator n=1 Tax=Ponticaulis sp. TaxID=2020902 RepID=UPI000C55DC93|nr:LysR family transcriptional regulator [Ponticaulis sp.]MAJ10426.1 LysR family transcriptional regulator [Ponticaulis sp.]MDF1680129.1 LysR family transcriptional regulator [Ponticaulis sp.]HBH90191.1 LysR family transcriptional regulator [Hyphomonadaceae bacterium]
MSQWDGIEEFVAVAQQGSFKRAAEVLGLSSSHVSRAVMRLEERLQSTLFFRTTRQVSLTDTGRSLFQHCEQLVQDRDEAFALIGGDREPVGELRVTCAVSLGERFVAPIVRSLMQDYPRLSVTVDLSNQRRDLVADGFDMAIRTGVMDDPRYIQTLIARRNWQVCASHTYLAQHKKPKTVEDLAGHECVMGSSETWKFEVDGEPVMFRPKGRFKCNSGSAVVEAVKAGLGICQLPDFYLSEGIASGELVPLLKKSLPPAEPVWAVYPQRRHLMPKVQKLVERLRAELGPAMGGAPLETE